MALSSKETERPREGDECHFFKLPRELRDKIYVHAYSRTCKYDPDAQYRVRDTETTEAKVETRSKPPTIADPQLSAPGALCRKLAVSKSFLEESLPIRIRLTTFYFGCPRDLQSFTAAFALVKNHITSIVVEYGRYHDHLGRNLRMPIGDFVNSCPRLVHVTAEIDGHALGVCTAKQWNKMSTHAQRKFMFSSPLDVNWCGAFEQLKKMRGLETFHLEVTGLSQRPGTEREEEYMPEEKDIRKYVTQKRVRPSEPTEQVKDKTREKIGSKTAESNAGT